MSLGVEKTVCVPSPDGERGKDGGQRSYHSPLQRETGASRLAKVSGLHIHTHTHLLSRRFRNCRLRSDHPQEGKQSLISALQGPALSPGLSPLHTTHYTLRATHRLPGHLTSRSLSLEIRSKNSADIRPFNGAGAFESHARSYGVCWRGTGDVIAGLETACLHTISVYTSGSHSSVLSWLSEAG